ncbi:MAG: hypothetical protein JWR30_3008, partial [Conexibacter sp.]|nr:hypothetical protein [Conexibacter sp.]
LRQNLLAVYESLAGIDSRPAIARLAEASSRLAAPTPVA